MSSQLERETKYDVPADFVLPTLPGVSPDEPPVEHDLSATYFDTSDLRLLRSRVTLRRRTGGADAGWHLKLPVSTGVRQELHRPLGRSQSVPKELADLVGAHVRELDLHPVAVLKTHRVIRLARDDAGVPLAEIADDTVTAQTLGDTTTAQHWREVEVEAVGEPDEPALDRIGRRLRRAGADTAGPSKLGRVLGERLPELASPGERYARPRTAGDVVLAAICEQLDAIIGGDLAVRRDLPDSVHEMRVATRRLRSSLRTFRSLFDPEVSSHLDAELRWLAASLGEARDCEVLLDRFTSAVLAQPVELVLGPVTTRIDDRLRPALHAARTQVLADLRSSRHFALLDALDAFVADPPLTERAAVRPRALRRGVAKATASLDRRVAAAGAAEPGPGRDVALHRVRKAAKRVRYACEVVEPVFGDDAGALGKAAKRVQTVLGDHQDSVVARVVLRELAVEAQAAPGEASFTFGLLVGLEQARAGRADRGLVAMWAAEATGRRRRWLS